MDTQGQRELPLGVSLCGGLQQHKGALSRWLCGTLTPGSLSSSSLPAPQGSGSPSWRFHNWLLAPGSWRGEKPQEILIVISDTNEVFALGQQNQNPGERVSNQHCCPHLLPASGRAGDSHLLTSVADSAALFWGGVSRTSSWTSGQGPKKGTAWYNRPSSERIITATERDVRNVLMKPVISQVLR